jgi:squalene-hopene/tetraprenyl-beta-curcumene cyclase
MPPDSVTMPNDTAPPDGTPEDAALNGAVGRAAAALLRHQRPDGHWVFPLEADATIPAEYVLLMHFLDRIDPVLEGKIGAYLRAGQTAQGGWPLFHDGAFNLSASVKAYFALKLIGDDPDAAHMRAAKAAILAAGGAERSNVFTRIQLALYGEIPWRGVPVMPLQIMLLPRWFPFHLDKVSYWSRTVTVPLLVLMARRPRARNPRGVHVPELFRVAPDAVRDWITGPFRSGWGHFFKVLDRALRVVEPAFPGRARSVDRAVAFVAARLNGEDGLGGIYPAMANAAMMFDTLGYAPDHPQAAMVWASLQKLLVVQDDDAYCQPCLSPVWDTGLAGHAIAEAAGAAAAPVLAANAWLRGRQVTAHVGDWAAARPKAEPGGWAFQYENPDYPDVDDTAVVGMLLHRQMLAARSGAADGDHAVAIGRARNWILGMQSHDGGWGAFDADNDKFYLNHIPFADHGALLDPPTADVTARCISFLAQIGHAATEPALARGLEWLRRDQRPDGSWFGRWGTNFIYGTWSVLCALNAAGVPPGDAGVRRAVGFLLGVQRADGGWGEDNETYAAAPPGQYRRSNPSQTAWALLGLMAAGEVDNPAVARGVAWLAAAQRADGEWDEAPYTAVGFPRVFYLRYHGYRLYFPLLAIARYRNLRRRNDRHVGWGF